LAEQEALEALAKSMSTHGNKNGLAKNLEKLQIEWEDMRVLMRPHIARWKKAPWNMHSYVNLFVEARRISPYLVGHVDAVLYPILISSSILLTTYLLLFK
jgi:hypothetical protein